MRAAVLLRSPDRAGHRLDWSWEVAYGRAFVIEGECIAADGSTCTTHEPTRTTAEMFDQHARHVCREGQTAPT